MKIRNVFFSMIVALAATNAAHAEVAPASSVDAAYSAYEREAARLENKLDVIQEGMKDLSRPVTQETARTLELQLAVLKARHDVALGKYLAEAAKQQKP
ncbi:TPA: hypothetical protein L5B66_005935 [Pseudomonas aeruginosa]|jgi:phage I-like protein|uniref:Secreted protein n=1 Tax=Pseudomonas aeruginosa TaxID=287 RepID=A0A1P8VP12_PSEAI|nr:MULTISPECIES: hypothetical protein [Pseudomonadota]UKK37771.1 hypothetical protein GVI60_26020 [Citrobacter freundii]APZ78351.1 Hypothetical protein [Pseudomonas aeruginosa]ERF04108.1 hypothetical protein PA13_1028715 [Pseudomonas aeruginosa HB13]OVZ34196.1 hypothetical protein CDO47_00180 [Pseudomonas aeruginosa]HBO5749365.1 hypothetical protein [Pseudomonas aeruginosa]